ncbi:uncharacterized protein LOC126299146 [Schistocerca gregaria]|uniref:uncharacterized protein LOC126299146 n=1 Tax=Schistocerca gregaria TaxID=7010 RepID=UPI00211E3ABD|nr:uncharacterized protein LOC126299146 [Schistocerca gregaria]
MDLFSSLLSVFVFTAVLKEPTTNSENFTPVVRGYGLPDRKFENAASFSQESKTSLTVDNSVVSADMGQFTEQYAELDMSKKTTVIQTTNTQKSEEETVEHIQLYTTDTFVAGMGHPKQGSDEYNVTIEQAAQGTLTPQSEGNTTVGNDTSVLQIENIPLYATTTHLDFTTMMVILFGAALIAAFIWRMWSNYFRVPSIEYTIRYKMQYSNGEFLTVEYHDTVTV